MIADNHIQPEDFLSLLPIFWDLSGKKILDIEKTYDPVEGAPVFTVEGKYSTRGWTEWTHGFQYGSAILQFDTTGDEQFLKIGRDNTILKMASHVSNTGVHDHGFNNVSTYGNLLRLLNEEKIDQNALDKNFYEIALKLSGAIQASRWTSTKDGGFIYSFNGPHSLFVDTIRTVRILELSYKLGHTLHGEQDIKINLLHRAVQHTLATARYSIYYGEGKDKYDEWGRTAHESIFNTNNGIYRCPNAQQGFSGYTTWTRGLSWAMLGFAEQLEFLNDVKDDELTPLGTKTGIEKIFLKAAKATCDFYIKNTPLDGIPYWDTGAPNLSKMENYLNQPADPFNDYEPVDSSAAAIGAQGLLRLGNYLMSTNEEDSSKYFQAGLTIAKRLLEKPYLSESPDHQGLLLHSIYHHPNGWDYIPEGSKIPNSESSMWGDYHIRELMLYLQRIIRKEKYYTFYGAID